MFAVACAGLQPKDPFAYGAYGTLATSLASYKVVLDVFTNLRAVGQVSDEKWVQFSKLANTFLDRHLEADKAMSDYTKGVKSQAQADIVMKLVNSALNELTVYYQNQIPKDKQRPLIS
jgi:hypothetical protein